MAKKETAPETLEQALKAIAEKDASIKQLTADLAEQMELVAELRKGSVKAAKPSFTLKGKTYEVEAGQFKHGEEIITAAQLCDNKELQAELVEMGVGFIKEIKE